jgi:hypothetical protein
MHKLTSKLLIMEPLDVHYFSTQHFSSLTFNKCKNNALTNKTNVLDS